MGLFEKLGQGQQAGQGQPMGQSQMTPEQQFQAMQQDVSRIQADPVGFLKARGYNIPGGMTDPRQITQYMLQNGMVGTNRLQQVMNMLGVNGRR